MHSSFNQDGGYDPNLLDQEPSRVHKEPQKFSLTEAMVSQKQLRKQTQEIVKIKEVLTEVQIYMQKHEAQMTGEMVDDIKLKVTIESLRNEIEIRLDLALKQFF